MDNNLTIEEKEIFLALMGWQISQFKPARYYILRNDKQELVVQGYMKDNVIKIGYMRYFNVTDNG
jgi:hypothetical protein